LRGFSGGGQGAVLPTLVHGLRPFLRGQIMPSPRRSNADLLQQLEQKNPLLGLGCSYSPYPLRLWIQDMKNYYVDYFRFASKHVHFIHFKARSRLPNEVVSKVEEDLRDQLLKANDEIDEAIVQAETLMKANGIMLSITDTPNCSPPLCHTAEIISPLTNRYIQLIEKTDYLLRALDPLFQKEVISMEEYNVRRGLFKRHVKRFYYACRRFDEGLRARMDVSGSVAANHPTKSRHHGAAGPKPKAATALSAPGAKAPSSGCGPRKESPPLETTERREQVSDVIT
jgi:hypothetical protein